MSPLSIDKNYTRRIKRKHHLSSRVLAASFCVNSGHSICAPATDVLTPALPCLLPLALCSGERPVSAYKFIVLLKVYVDVEGVRGEGGGVGVLEKDKEEAGVMA